MSRAADSSVTIPGLLDGHPAHEHSAEALSGCTATIAHVAAETYSVLTRLPPPNQTDAAATVEVLDERLPARFAALSASDYAQAPGRLAAADVSGGATYDGLIALTALAHGLELLTRDGRAVRTYQALGVRYTLVG